MFTRRSALICVAYLGILTSVCLGQSDAPLPQGVQAVWDLAKAQQEKTPTRTRICLNGLWRWQPAQSRTQAVPSGNWGYAKVPGAWPGCSGDYMWRDSQTYYPHPSWAKSDLSKVTIAWHQREISIPADWSGRRVAVSLEYLYTVAAVYVDGTKMGEAIFPGGEVDITTGCKTPGKHVLSILAAAPPMGEEKNYFTAGDTGGGAGGGGKKSRSAEHVELRALCGDVYLLATPAQTRLTDVKIDPSVRKGEITFDVGIAGASPSSFYTLHAQLTDGGPVGLVLASKRFSADEIVNGRFAYTASLKSFTDKKLWDLNTPGNRYKVGMSLQDAHEKVVDVLEPASFGFREFWIDGKDFYLNGTRLNCFVVPIDSAQTSCASASYDGARETLRRLKAAGVNLVYTHNYTCKPGTHLSFEQILRAADDVGMLVALALPHAEDYDWKSPAAAADYARLAEFYVRAAQNHPCVVLYAMNHNMCGYSDMANPEHIDGLHDMTGQSGGNDFGSNGKLALKTQAIVKGIDATRPIYHHSGGNVGQIYTMNIYLNQVPIQEKSDWFAHWAATGVKPLFLCEYGTPSDLDWTTYRGWFRGKREWWSAQITWEECFGEWGSQYRGDKAFDLSEKEKSNLRFEAKQWRAGKVWYRWDYPYNIPDQKFDVANILDVQAMFITDNWRAFRTWGVSAFNSWEFDRLWTLRDGHTPAKKTFKVDWENLQQPGFSPDVLDKQPDSYAYGYEVADWIPTSAAQALVRNSQPLLAYLADKGPHFTGKEHNFYAGQPLEKQLIVINNSRQRVACDAQWSFALPQAMTGGQKFNLETGQQQRIALHFDVPISVAPGAYDLSINVKFDGAATQSDTQRIHIFEPRPGLKVTKPVALLDPQGQTAAWLQKMGVLFDRVEAGANLSRYDVLVIGKGALAPDGPGPDIGRVADGLKVLMFEQTSQTLEKRLGLRVEEYGLRWVFERLPDHPVLENLSPEHFYNWRGQATILPPQLPYTFDKYKDPTIQWSGLDVSRPWRAGDWGNVASVLIEKPGCGDFLPILDGGFSLQYAPLLEFRQGKGMVLFCQMDVTGRSDADPAADRLARQLMSYALIYQPRPQRSAVYAGEEAGLKYLAKTGLNVAEFNGDKLFPEQVLIVGPGGGAKLAAHKNQIASWLQGGGHLLALGLDDSETNAFWPQKMTLKKGEYISTFFAPPPMNSPLAGVGPADVINRDPRSLWLASGGAESVGNGVLATGQNGNAVFFAMAPWQFDPGKQYNLKRVYRRCSFAVVRILANMGVAASTPLLERFHNPPEAKAAPRYLDGLYIDHPQEWDDPYRYFCW